MDAPIAAGSTRVPAPGDALQQRDAPLGLGLREALVWRRWHSSPSSRARLVSGLLALVLLMPVHVALAVVAGQWWSLLALPANPSAFYLFVRGWAYRDMVWFGAGYVVMFVGNFVPFYLPR